MLHLLHNSSPVTISKSATFLSFQNKTQQSILQYIFKKRGSFAHFITLYLHEISFTEKSLFLIPLSIVAVLQYTQGNS